MADPLSVAGTAVGIVSLGLQVCQGLINYYQTVKNQSKDISTTIQSLARLSTSLENFNATISRRRFAQRQSKLVLDIEHHIYTCEDAIDELDQELEKFTAQGSGVRHLIKSTTRKAIYPFREGTLMKLRENIQDILENLALASNILLLDTSSEVLDSISQVSTVLSLLKADLVSGDIRQWLNAPNTHGQHEDACSKRHKNTGLWLVDGSRFKSWLSTKASFLWLNGFAGSGKTILASTIIQEILAYRDPSATIGIAYFYLSYADTSKQSSRGLIKSLLLQLSCQSSSTVLNDLYADYSSGGPPEYALSLALEAIVKAYTDVYLVVDALDESPKGENRNAVCKLINKMREWNNVHLLVTSRDEPDIREALAVPKQYDVSINNDEVADDIGRFVKEALREDIALIKWKLFYGEIESALIQGAGGMFRWVDCQFLALRACLTANMLRTTLQSLPTTLDATYDRMLASINPQLKEFARRLLTLLCFSGRPLRVCELTEALAITIDNDDGQFDFGDKIFNMSDLLTVCPGMIRVGGDDRVRQTPPVEERDLDFSDRAISRRVKNADRRFVRLAHFSVREYLVSDRILLSSREFHLQADVSHTWIAKICLVYLSMPSLRLPPDLKPIRVDWYIGAFDFFLYAQDYWAIHAIRSGEERSLVPLVKNISTSSSLYTVLLTLQDTSPDHYVGCVKMYQSDMGAADRISMAIKWLAHHGATQILEVVLAQPWDFVNMDRAAYEQLFQSSSSSLFKPSNFSSLSPFSPSRLLPAYERECKLFDESAVNIAIRERNWRVVDLLLEKFFRPSKKNSGILDPLQIAARNGMDKTVELLLPNSRTLNPGDYPPQNQTLSSQHPLLMAAWHGHVSTVEILLGRCTSLVEGRHGVTALHIAARRGHLQLVEFLIKKFLSVGWYFTIDHQTDFGSTATMRAAECGQDEIVKLLIESGADWRTRHDADGNSVLFHAVRNDRLDIVQFLTERGIRFGLDMTLRNGRGESPEEVARGLGLDDMTEYLSAHWPTAPAKLHLERSRTSQEAFTSLVTALPFRPRNAKISPLSPVAAETASNSGRARRMMPWHSRVLALSSTADDVVTDDDRTTRDPWEEYEGPGMYAGTIT